MIEELGHCPRWKRIFQLSTVYRPAPPQVARRKRFTTSSGAWPIPADVLIFDVTASGNSATWCNGLLWSLGHHTISSSASQYFAVQGLPQPRSARAPPCPPLTSANGARLLVPTRSNSKSKDQSRRSWCDSRVLCIHASNEHMIT